MEAARRNGATAVWVFGSVARGDAQPGSDIDLLVELEPGRSLLDLAGLHLELCDLLDLPVDVGAGLAERAHSRQGARRGSPAVRSDRDRLLDIAEEIEAIERYAERGKEAYDADELIRAWMLQRIQVIGEAVARLSTDMKDRHPEVPWRRIADMRNLLVHSYFRVDPEVVWAVVADEVPVLKEQIQNLLEEADG